MMHTLRKLDSSLGLVLDEGARIMFLIFSAAALSLCVAYQLLAVTYRYSLDYGEAPLVDQAMRLASGQNIYRADISTPPYTISNYPPLYVTLVAASVTLFGPANSFYVGRIISILSTWMSSILLMLIVYAPTRDRFAALSTGLIFLAFPFVIYWSPLLRIDMLALALSLAALCLLVWEPASPRRLVAVSLLLVAAIYTRQSYALAAPFAAFVWLLAQDWRQALKLTVLVSGLTLTLFLVLNGLTHGGFFFNIVTANINEFRLDLLEYNWDRLREAALILLCIGGVSLFLIRRWNPLWTLAVPYLIGATLSAATIGKIGSNVNYLMELCAALSLSAGVLVATSRAHLSVYSLRAALLIILAIAVGKMMHITLQDYTGDLRERRAARGELSQLESIVAETPGPILADEYMGMLTLQGRPLVIQPFEVTQLARDGKWDQTPLLERIKNKEFASIILYDRQWSNERWTPEMLSAIDQSYRLIDVVAENKIYSAFQRKVSNSLPACPGALWRLPSDGSLGVQWREGGIDFLGQGNEGKVPVYAVAAGLLTRLTDWADAVAILHDDPFNPGAKLWSYYGDMAAANGTESYVVQDFPSGVSGIPVQAGQLLGYQGTWSGKPFWSTWIHMHFNLIRAVKQEAFPSDELTFEDMLDPTPYLNLALQPQTENENSQSLKCRNP
jgi:4-amino-4-deoxy-L-arabinose transferase-like glycosyltransferase